MKHDSDSTHKQSVGGEDHRDDAQAVAVLFGREDTRPNTLGDRLGKIFFGWLWFTRHAGWMQGVRTLARTLSGLQGAGLVERQRVRGDDGQILHLIRVTELGASVLALLRGDDSGVDP